MCTNDRYLFFMQIPEVTGTAFVKQAQRLSRDTITVLSETHRSHEQLHLWSPPINVGREVSALFMRQLHESRAPVGLETHSYHKIADIFPPALTARSSVIIALRQDIITSLQEYGFTAHASAPDTPLNIGARYDAKGKFKELILTQMYALEVRDARG